MADKFRIRGLTSANRITAQIVRKRAGWYFIRFYNCHDELIDSLDFRFIGLLAITIHQNCPIPSSAGH